MARTVKNNAQEAKEATAGFTPYPAGDYLVEIIDVEQGAFKSQANAGVPKLDVQFRILEPAETDEGRVLAGKKFKDFGIPDQPKWKNGKVAFMYYQFYKALEVDFSKDGDVDLPDYDDMLGMELGVTLDLVQKVKDGVKVTDDEGEPVLQNNVKAYWPTSRGIKTAPGASGSGGATDEFDLDA